MSQRTLLGFGVSIKRKIDDVCSEPESQSPSKRSNISETSTPNSKQRTFQKVWLKQFPWLEYDDSTRRMFCKLCRAADIHSSFTKEGAGNLQRSTVVRHNDSKPHKNAVESHHMRKQLYGVPVTDEPETESSHQEPLTQKEPKDSEKHLFRTVHFCAIKNLPNSMVNEQLNFLRASGVDPKIVDIHPDSVKDVQSSLVHIINEDMRSRIMDSKYYGIIIDESTDLSIHKKLVIYVRYVYDGEIHTDLVGNLRIRDGCAATIVECLNEQIKVLGLDMVNLVGLGTGSDGASVMFGKTNGVGVQLKPSAPLMVHIHCIAHRLALACADAAKDIPYLKTYRNTLKNLYIHVNGSGIRQFKLERMQEIMEEPSLKLKDPISIRWLAMEDAVVTIHKCYGSIVAYLQSNEGKNTVGDNVAEGLLKEVLHYKFPAFTALLADILTIIGVLCKQLQSDSLDISQFNPMKETTVGKLNGLIKYKGDCETEFLGGVSSTNNKLYYKGIQMTHANEKSQMDTMKSSYIKSVVTNMGNRMSCNNNPVLEAYQLFEPSAHLTDEQETSFISTLADHYGLDRNKLGLEYSGISNVLKGSYKNMSFQKLTKLLISRHEMDYPLCVKLCRIGLCIPVSSVACERGFSLQNKIKVKSRTSLTPENLESLMKISAGPTMQEFPYARAIRHWNLEKKRRLRR